MATKALSSKQSVYWLACGPWTDKLIAAAMKKMGCEAAASYTRDSSSSSPLNICSVTVDMSARLESSEDFDAEVYVKELYHSIRSWVQTRNGAALIVVDDASILASLVGERLSYCFLLSLRALVKRTNNNLLIRCSQDYDLDLLKEEDTSSVRPGASRNVDWVCAGGAIHDAPIHIPWDRGLPELADGIVNVEPLPSGYSREAHGRLVFVSNDESTTRPIVMNYCCQDTSVSAIRLRGPTTASK